MKFTRIVEFGPGDSTLAFLDAGCQVVSFKHDPSWLRAAADRLTNECNVKLRPCGCFLLHDARRHEEQAKLLEMKRRGVQVVKIPTRKGMALVFDPERRPDLRMNRVEQALARYVSEGASGWYTDEEIAWRMLFGSTTLPAKLLEIGSGDGLSANLDLDLLFENPKSEVHCILDPQESANCSARLEVNSIRGGHGAQLSLYEGLSREILAWMIAEDGFRQSFDLIHLSASGDAPCLLADTCQAWGLLKPGGVMIFGEPVAGRVGRDAFLSVYSPLLEVVLEGERTAIRKL